MRPVLFPSRRAFATANTAAIAHNFSLLSTTARKVNPAARTVAVVKAMGMHISVIVVVMMVCHRAPPSRFFAIIPHFSPTRNPDGGIFPQIPLTNPHSSAIMLNWNIRDENCCLSHRSRGCVKHSCHCEPVFTLAWQSPPNRAKNLLSPIFCA